MEPTGANAWNPQVRVYGRKWRVMYMQWGKNTEPGTGLGETDQEVFGLQSHATSSQSVRKGARKSF